MIVYLDGMFLEKKDAMISPDDRGFCFGDGVYEVVRIYNGQLFSLYAHLYRLKRNIDELKIDGFDVSVLPSLFLEILKLNQLENLDAVLYVQITRGAAVRSHCFPIVIKPTLYITASQLSISRYKQQNGVSVLSYPDLRWSRCDIKTINLLPNVLANEFAKKGGAEEAVFVKDNIVTEGSHTNVFAVFNGSIFTHPTGTQILSGITRDVVFELCNKNKIQIKEKTFSINELQCADEIFLSGTTSEIMPVILFDKYLISKGKKGKITKKIQDLFYAFVFEKTGIKIDINI